jgi:hypothetical protein
MSSDLMLETGIGVLNVKIQIDNLSVLNTLHLTKYYKSSNHSLNNYRNGKRHPDFTK